MPGASALQKRTPAQRPDDGRYIASNRFNFGNLLARLAPASNPAPTVSGDAPTISVGTAATVSGGLFYGPQHGDLTVLGTRGAFDATNNRLNASATCLGADFFLTGDTVELGFLTPNSTSQGLLIFVDGQPHAASTATITVTAQARNWLKLVFGSSKRRRVEVFLPRGQALYGIAVPAGQIITPAPRRPVVAFVGDSFFDGAIAGPLESMAFSMARLLGVECVNRSYGGTGYVATNGGVSPIYGAPLRVTEIASTNPELIVISGSVNDDGSAASVGAAAAACYAAYATACPNARIVVFGPQPSSATATISANRATNIAVVKAAAAAAPNVVAFIDLVGTAAGTPPAAWSSSTAYADGALVTYLGSVWQWSNAGATGPANVTPGQSAKWKLVTYLYTGTGSVGATAGNGTRDVYLASDAVHPTVDASAALAIRCSGVIRDTLLALARPS